MKAKCLPFDPKPVECLEVLIDDYNQELRTTFEPLQYDDAVAAFVAARDNVEVFSVDLIVHFNDGRESLVIHHSERQR